MVLVALMAGILCLSAGQCGPTKVQRPEIVPTKKESPAKRSSVVLTDRNPTSTFALEPDLPKAQTDVLELTVSRVVNPSMTAVNISVYFAAEKSQSQSNSEKVLVGSFTLYPPDRPGKFLLPASTVWRETAKAPKSSKPGLIIELERVNAAQPWTSVEVEILKPEFRPAEK